ncbi:hypothetical protein [Pleionea litopenaei]|uniref:Uncharacterized protein n=1 Tax=Pleionea litopenaei TaxID=3070815 RepID=A0AA51RUF8_9GAMM|nr:hypothetical protein [Pleionea sp. HL-JVS1]WMS87780.1 hypothetical protein Q9312_02370 [Pleionea sp. HL-JVS1]
MKSVGLSIHIAGVILLVLAIVCLSSTHCNADQLSKENYFKPQSDYSTAVKISQDQINRYLLNRYGVTFSVDGGSAPGDFSWLESHQLEYGPVDHWVAVSMNRVLSAPSSSLKQSLSVRFTVKGYSLFENYQGQNQFFSLERARLRELRKPRVLFSVTQRF